MRLRLRACACGAETHRACTARVRCFAPPHLEVGGAHAEHVARERQHLRQPLEHEDERERRERRQREPQLLPASSRMAEERGREGARETGRRSEGHEALLRVRPCSEGGVGCRGSRLARGRRGARTRRRPRAA